jgi:hypothetical protein
MQALNNILGRTGGTGDGESPPAQGRSSLFEEEAELLDHLAPVPGNATITQEDSGTGGATGGLVFPPAAPPPHVGGGGGAGGGTPPATTDAYSGIGTVLNALGHTMYDPVNLKAELAVQQEVTPSDTASRQTFKDFVVNVQQFRGYLAMLGGKHVVTMLHTPGVYYSISTSTKAYQGRVLAFIGDRRLTKEPTPVCLPTTKAWEWHTGPAITDYAKLDNFFDDDANGGKLWTPSAADGTPADIEVPYLLAIPSVLVDLLRTQGPAPTPYEVLTTIDEFVNSSATADATNWELLRKWCLVASQTGTGSNSAKSKLNLDTTPVTIDDEGFDRWVGTRLDVSFGPRPTIAASVPAHHAPAAGSPAADYLALSKMFATNMLQLSQNIVSQAGAAATLGGSDTALATGKGFDQDQIAKLKDVCGVRSGANIPTIWSIIQASKGKSYDTYRAHLSKSMDAWARTHHIELDKSTHFDSKFFEDLVALRFNPGGPVVQYISAARGMSMLACRSMSAVDAELSRDWEEAAAHTKNTRSLEDMLKVSRKKTAAPAGTYSELKLNIGTYCGLLWSLFGDNCDYYKELLKIYRILDRQECFAIRDAYTREVCARITWAILDDGRSFFGQTVVAADFAPGARGPRATSYLESIADAVRNANVVQRATFPREWMTTPTQANPYQTPPAGAPPTNWEVPPGVTPGGAQPTTQRNQTKKTDVRHPKIKQLMDPYLKRYNGYVNLAEILTSSGKRMSDLPTLPNYTSAKGDTFICWNSALGTCFQGKRCRYSRGHLKQGDATDAFAEATLECISKGVLYYTNLPAGSPDSPVKKRKAAGGDGAGTP